MGVLTPYSGGRVIVSYYLLCYFIIDKTKLGGILFTVSYSDIRTWLVLDKFTQFSLKLTLYHLLTSRHHFLYLVNLFYLNLWYNSSNILLILAVQLEALHQRIMMTKLLRMGLRILGMT